jgi:hypothetical protein
MFKSNIDYSIRRMCHIVASPVGKRAFSGDLRYVAVTLKKLNRGQPLLPLASQPEALDRPFDEWEWEEGAIELGLAIYLRTFLCLLGYSPLAAQIYDRLDCKRVRWYQAVVQASVWEEIWAALETPFGEQRAAYRRLRGGCHAPVLSCPAEPSFAPLLEQGFLARGAGLANRAVPLRISKTFLEVSTTPELVKRSQSMPTIRDKN